MTPEEVECEETERDRLIMAVLGATTIEQCIHARESIITWMKTHPRDFGILDAGGQIEKLLEGYSLEAAASHKAA